MEKLLNARQMAGQLAISVKSLRKLIKEGLPHLMVGKTYRFDDKKVREWLKKSTR